MAVALPIMHGEITGYESMGLYINHKWGEFSTNITGISMVDMGISRNRATPSSLDG
jgi:hypothetical protein